MSLSLRATRVLRGLGWTWDQSKCELWKELVSLAKKMGRPFWAEEEAPWSEERYVEMLLFRQRGSGVVTREEIFKWFGKTRPAPDHECICRTCGKRVPFTE